ncbi:LolA family protein [Prauserella muralis]|uniref:MucB/RseB N-terminal domain-containing protein n=1 Tax=Prauserella muralis TaxID=588067 RepID=A0A2V4ALJ1_9PSEU|nr:sigma-E factor regulatory protein RseB domain-containing protein [Prauserella muralis]PXY21168.1 hypothetical protein BAY60_27260 [Prauserella muralis]TWE30259.1 MucB/RseB family protein [Prauserella muralis]
MNPKRKALAVAVAGTALGAAGLGLLAVPAGAGEAPELPPVGAQALVQSVLEADPPALAGTVAFDNQLGLPSMPGVPMLDMDSARVYYDGEGDSRIAVQDGNSEQTIVRDGNTVWMYDSATDTATKTDARSHHPREENPQGRMSDPAAAAADLVSDLRASSTVSVDGTARVAGRPAYELVLTPKPEERTLLREVRVAVDSESRLPLRLSVLTNGTTEPALQLGFTDIDFGAQPAELFEFTPPRGATVTEAEPDVEGARDAARAGEPRLVGEGWDAVLVGRVPADVLSGGEEDGNVRGMLDRLSTRVSGDWGSGQLVSTSIGTAILTDDGRFALGAVPQQVLTKALATR